MAKVLAWGDYACTTGFGNVMSHLMQAIHGTGEYEIDVCAINYDGSPYDPKRFPGTIYPARSHLRNDPDMYGKQTFLNLAASKEYDLVFILHDPKVVASVMPKLKFLQSKMENPFRIIYYFPVDAPLYPLEVKLAIEPVEFAVTYTEYAASEVHRVNPDLPLNIFYHGTDLQDFHHVRNTKVAKEELLGEIVKDKFIISNINTNSYRKDIPRCFMLLNELRKRGHDDIVMYLHMERQGKGGDLVLLGRNFGLLPQKDFLFPADSVFETNDRIPVNVLNMLYNLSDCVFTTSRGEGWGLSVTEAMATKTPIVAPNHTSLAEILADERGYLTKCGGGGMYDNFPEDDRLRPLADVSDMADKIELIKSGDLPDVEEAFNWVKHNSWESIGQHWIGLFAEAVRNKEIKEFSDPYKNIAPKGARSDVSL